MVIINSREFRANQGKYLGMAANGEGVVLRSRMGSFKITPVTGDDTLISKEEFFRKIDQAYDDIKAGKGIVVNSREELNAYLDNL